jgi:hypothetical protein
MLAASLFLLGVLAQREPRVRDLALLPASRHPNFWRGLTDAVALVQQNNTFPAALKKKQQLCLPARPGSG